MILLELLLFISVSFGQENQCEEYSVLDFVESIEYSDSNQDESKGYQKCQAALEAPNSKQEFKSLYKEIESACGSLRSPPKNLVPPASCCKSSASPSHQKKGDTCGGFDPTNHSICLYHNSNDLVCPVSEKRPNKALETLYEEYYHSLQTCLQRSGNKKFRSLPYRPSELFVEFELKRPPGDSKADNKAKYRCSQVSIGKHNTWCIEMGAKCNNPYASPLKCEEFCSGYASDDKFEAGCCLQACEKKQQACCDWFDK